MMAAKGKTHVDVAFWGGVIPGNQVRYVQDIWQLRKVAKNT